MLVIDDLHELDSPDALEWLKLFLRNLRWGLRVILATREDPRLGLHRLRLSGQLTELRAPDFRFSMEETAELLRAEGISLSDRAVERLYVRTEGWAAGLRLAAISLAHHPDPERFVTEFSGSERNVAAYLLAEVLQRQTPEVRDMLLRTSVLERVCGPLADFLTGGSGAERMLQDGGRERVRDLLGRKTGLVSLPPSVRGPAPAGAPANRARDGRVVASGGGRVSRGAGLHRRRDPSRPGSA